MATLKDPCDEGVIRSGKASAPTSAPWILAATIIGSAMAFIDGTVVNVALPEIQARMNATAVDAQWIIESYALFLAALILIGGSLGDHYGHRRIFALGTALFAAASVWCGISGSPEELVVARAVQGVGGAMLVPGSLAIISASFEEERQSHRHLVGLLRAHDGHRADSGRISNAVSRTAGLLAIPLLGLSVFAAFSASLDARVAALDLPPEARQQLEAEKVDLGAAQVPESLGGATAAAVRRAIDRAFVAGFRTAMFVAAGLALASAVAAGIIVEGKGKAVRSEEAKRVGGETAPA